MIRVNLLPREEKSARAGAPSLKLNVRVGDMVLPLVILGAAVVVIAGAALSQRSRAASLDR